MAEHQKNNILACVDGANHNDENSNIEDDVEISNKSDRSSSSDPVFDTAQQSHVPTVPQSVTPECLGSQFNMGLDQNTVSQEGIRIGSNGRRKVECFEIADHLVVPNYPATSSSGILHLVPFPSPLVNVYSKRDGIKEAFARVQSRIQFSSRAASKFSETSLQLLAPRQGTKEKACHQTYKCTGIQHYEYTDPDILSTCATYDRPKMETIISLRKRSGRQLQTRPIEHLLREHTEAFFNGFVQLWQKNRV